MTRIWLIIALAQGFNPSSYFVALDTFGTPIAGAQLYVYKAGTTIPAESFYCEKMKHCANTNPVFADSHGRMFIYLNPTLRYRLVLVRPEALIWRYNRSLIVWEVDAVGVHPARKPRETHKP